MSARYPGDPAAANDFGRRTLDEWEAYLLHEANYPTPPNVRAPSRWWLSAGGVPVPPLPVPETSAYFPAEIERARASLTAEERALPEYATDNHAAWAAYFRRRQEERLASTNNAPTPRGRNNSKGRRLWWGVPGRTLSGVLAHLEGGNDPPFEYLTARGGGAWLPRRMMGWSSSSSSSSSRSSSHSSDAPALVSVKPEPSDTLLDRRTRGAGLVINDGGRGSSSSAPPRVVKPKREPRLATVKPEPGLAAVKPEPALAKEADEEEGALKWAREDYARMELDRQRRALEEIAERRRREAARRGEGSSSGAGRVKEEKQEDDAGDDYALLSAYFGP